MDVVSPIRGSELLLCKLPLVAKAHTLAREDPADPQAECNVLSYSTDVYRVLAGINTYVALPTHMTFLTALENARREEKRKETETTTAVHSNEEETQKGKEKEENSEDDENDFEEDNNNEEYDEEVAVAMGSVQRGKEELKLLHSIREPLERIHGIVRGRENTTGHSLTTTGLNNNNNNNNNNKRSYNYDRMSSISSSGVITPAGRISWEVLLESLMTRAAAAGDEDDEKVRSYLRRVSWIEQQKKLHTMHNGSLEALEGREQSWMSMSEVMRVQKEIQRMRSQRNRFHRAKK
ncbi:hypothetical protein LSM04_007559 [Trypanosoma melophagium]|uniref:uncharacterized protein n=1 Tax=Trypanosoma melophagium TaxID=715481 RepID=UPI003519F79C|nr:hypothetical protein LSM04_007559 [Trypanosoma melophagium]